MRVSIRVQLGLLVLATNCAVLCVIAVVVWTNSHAFVMEVISSQLALAASLKAAQVSSSLQILNSTIAAATSRVFIQQALRNYNDNRNNTEDNWDTALSTLLFALSSGTDAGLLQAVLYPRDASGPAGLNPLLNATVAPNGSVKLPYTHPNGSAVFLGDADLGFPPSLYPNLTIDSDDATPYPFNTSHFTETRALLLGPLTVNESYALLSITVPVVNNGTSNTFLGYMTVVANAQLILNILSSKEGLFSTGETLLVAPSSLDNHFPGDELYQGNVNTPDGKPLADYPVHFALLPIEPEGTDRHLNSDYSFPMKQYPAVLDAFTSTKNSLGESHSIVSTTNEEGHAVSVGYATPNTTLCDWVLLVEEAKREAYGPINKLRNIILACVFGTLGAVLVFVVPLSYYAVRPIRDLKEATVMTRHLPESPGSEKPDVEILALPVRRRDRFFGLWKKRQMQAKASIAGDSENGTFTIPSKVRIRRRFVSDEFTDLCQTYNEMIDELLIQYETLDERVKERTRELELSKKIAEVANESKTHFIASISHELKTPLNGILGMCSICMSETDINRIKKSLAVVNDSGELLLHLLDDVLTYSKHQLNRQIVLEEKNFQLGMVSSQLITIFQKQAIDREIDLNIMFENSLSLITSRAPKTDAGATSVVNLEDLPVWGDKNRILQVLINLVSNSLKFTPKGGSVQVRIRRIEDDKANRNSTSRPASARYSLPPIQSTETARALPVKVSRPPNHRANSSVPPMLCKTCMFEFDVEDSGPGIPDELHERIFEPFVQGDVGLSRKYSGTGLGLSICTQLAQVMDGRILLKSAPGLGSTFTMQIPIRVISDPTENYAGRMSATFDEERRASRTASEMCASIRSLQISSGTGKASPLVGVSQLHSRQASIASVISQDAPPADTIVPVTREPEIRVLVVDDNAINQEIVQRMLKLEKITNVTLASDGQEAYDKVREVMAESTTYSTIFMDIQMPVLDGIQSTRMIRQLGYQAPIVALTAFAEEENIKECLESGMNHFLPKPIRRPALKEVLKQYCKPVPVGIAVAGGELGGESAAGLGVGIDDTTPTEVRQS